MTVKNSWFRKVVFVVFVVSALIVAISMVTFAQGNSGKPAEPASAQATTPKTPDDFTAVYVFSGAAANLPDANSKIATSVHCTNMGANDVNVLVEIADYDGDPIISSGSFALPSGQTRTVSTQNTAVYSEDIVIPAFTDDIGQGNGRIYVDAAATLICTAQTLDPIGAPPSFVVNLDLYPW